MGLSFINSPFPVLKAGILFSFYTVVFRYRPFSLFFIQYTDPKAGPLGVSDFGNIFYLIFSDNINFI